MPSGLRSHSPEDLFVVGRSYAMAAVMVAAGLDEAEEMREALMLPIWHLVGMAVELLLKAAFLQLGGAPSELFGKGGIGHDLQKALDRAVETGFQPPTEYTAVLVDRLRQTHLDHTMRYLPDDVEVIVMPRLGDAFDAVRKLIGSVWTLVYPDEVPDPSIF